MPNVVVHRYADGELGSAAPRGVPAGVDWEGYVESEDKTWILFVPKSGAPVLYADRNPETGAVH